MPLFSLRVHHTSTSSHPYICKERCTAKKQKTGRALQKQRKREEKKKHEFAALSLSLCDAPNRQINKALHASLMRKKKKKINAHEIGKALLSDACQLVKSLSSELSKEEKKTSNGFQQPCQHKHTKKKRVGGTHFEQVRPFSSLLLLLLNLLDQ